MGKFYKLIMGFMQFQFILIKENPMEEATKELVLGL